MQPYPASPSNISTKHITLLWCIIIASLLHPKSWQSAAILLHHSNMFVCVCVCGLGWQAPLGHGIPTDSIIRERLWKISIIWVQYFNDIQVLQRQIDSFVCLGKCVCVCASNLSFFLLLLLSFRPHPSWLKFHSNKANINNLTPPQVSRGRELRSRRPKSTNSIKFDRFAIISSLQLNPPTLSPFPWKSC